MHTRFWNLIRPPIYEQEEKNKVASWLQIMLVFVTLSALLLAFNSIFFFPDSGSWPNSLLDCGVALICLYFNRKGKMTIATLLLLLWLLGDATRGLYIGNGIHDTAMLFVAAVITLGGLLLRRRTYLILFALVIAAISFIVFSEVQGWIVSPLSSQTDYSDIVMITVFLGGQALVIALVMNAYFKSLQAERRNAQTLSVLLNAFRDPMFLIDTAGHYIYLNEAQANRAGSTASDLLGKRSYDNLPPDLAREHENLVAEVIHSGRPGRLERQAAGDWFEHNFYPIHDEKGLVYRIAVYIRDVTFYKKATEEIQSLNTQLEQRVLERTSQLEATNRELEAFSYSVSHDLRAPLRFISGYAKILDDDYSNELSQNARALLEKIRLSATRMGLLIDGLLNLSQLGRKVPNKQMVDMNEIVRQVIDAISAETTERQIEWEIANMPPTHADETLIRQVYANLIGNAVKFTRKCERAHIQIGSFLQNNEQVYFVRDNGAGFDMQFANKLFGVFQRLHQDNDFEGTGIGLAIVQRIIHRHHGCVWAEAEPDKGACFYFTFTPK